jgi:hypothetical protein
MTTTTTIEIHQDWNTYEVFGFNGEHVFGSKKFNTYTKALRYAEAMAELYNTGAIQDFTK